MERWLPVMIAALLAATTIVATLTGFAWLRTAARFRRRARSVTGFVTESCRRAGIRGGPVTWRPEVRYRTSSGVWMTNRVRYAETLSESRTREAREALRDPAYEEGRAVSLLVDPVNPNDIRLENASGEHQAWSLVTASGFASLVALAALALIAATMTRTP